jgi:malonyl-ACP O-methyltransferase BioC
MQNAINKELIRKRFQRSLTTYSQHASVQRNMAEKLVNYLSDNAGSKFDNIFEIGCGTGNLTNYIINNLSFQSFITNDIVDDAKNHIQTFSDKISFLSGDVELIELPKNQDLIISNASFQWIFNMPEFLKKLHACLNTGGILAFTSFSPNNFQEISALTGCKLNYFSRDKYLSAISDILEPIYYTDELIALEFKDPLEVLSHIKQIGVNSLNQGFWTRKRLSEFRINYIKHFSSNDKVKLTYCPEYYIFRAK